MTSAVGENILLTGASGMLGTAVRKVWRSKYAITGLSRSGTNGTLACDLTDEPQLKKIFDSHKFSLVLHTAAHSDVDSCEKDPKMAYDSNAVATRNLARLCDQFKAPFIHISTDYVFDGLAHAPYKEADATLPIQVYGLTKLAAEYFVRQMNGPYRIVRTSWLFGAGNPKNFVNFMAEKIKNEKEISVLGDQVSSPTYAEDLAAWLAVIAADLLKNAGQKLYHACNSGTTTRYKMTAAMKDILGYTDRKVLETDRKNIPQRLAARPAYSAMDNHFLSKELHLDIRGWQDSLTEYLQSQKSSACASSSRP